MNASSSLTFTATANASLIVAVNARVASTDLLLGGDLFICHLHIAALAAAASKLSRPVCLGTENILVHLPFMSLEAALSFLLDFKILQFGATI